LAVAAMAWYQAPHQPMAAQDQHGSISVIEWQHNAFWRHAPAELPDNLKQFMQGVDL
jgi:hypothetical protein